MQRKLYTKYSNDRADQFNICTEIVVDDNGVKSVVKRPYSEKSRDHINNLYRWFEYFTKQYENSKFIPNTCEKTGEGVRFEYIEGVSFDTILDDFLHKDDMASFINAVNEYIKAVMAVSGNGEFVETEQFREVFGDIALPDHLIAAPVTNIDLIFPNIIVTGDKWNIIDYEWTFDFPIPVNYVIYRALFFYSLESGNRRQLHNMEFFQSFGITEEEVYAYDRMQKNFQKYVNGSYVPHRDIYDIAGRKATFIQDLIDNVEKGIQLYELQLFYRTGDAFSEQESDLYTVQPDEDGVLRFKSKAIRNVVQFRIDPANRNCMVSIEEVYGMTADKKKVELSYETNGCDLGNGVVVFTTDDPQIYINLNGEEIDQLHFDYRIGMIDKKFNEAVEKSVALIGDQFNALNDEKTEVEKAKDELEADRDLWKRAFHDTKHLLNLEIEKSRKEEVRMEQLLSSPSWKLTAPLRGVRGVAVKATHNKYTRLFAQGMNSVKRNGVKVTIHKIKGWDYKRKNKKNGVIDEPDISAEDFILSSIPELENCDKAIAVQVHLYYEDLLEEFCGYLDNIPYKFDLFISCQESADAKAIKERAEQIKYVNKVEVKPCPNRGRDVAPMFVWFRDEIKKYDYVLHMHTKKSLYTGEERVGWRQYSLESLIGSPQLVKKIFHILEEEDGFGLVYPDNHEDVPMLAYSWLANEAEGRRLLADLGVPFDNGIFTYPAGSFYWAKVKAFKPLFDRKFTIEDFPEEAGQTDGTLAHAIERGIEFVAKSRHYVDAIVDTRENVVRKITSNKAFRSYYEVCADVVEEYLATFDTISFDIFDTLITRCVLKPDDVFELLERKIKTKYGISLDYLSVRKQAEAKAWEKKQCYTNIHDIYAEMPAIANITEDQAEQFKQLEISTEKDLLIPRRDVLMMFNYLKKKKKKIILVSDMYMTKEILTEILNNCGYYGWDEMFVSCDCGARKDNNTIWDQILPKYGKGRFTHVGDNTRSDWQTLIDRNMEATWVINPFDAFRMSPFYASLKKYVDTGIENSLILGMALNGGIFNSPYAPAPKTGIPQFTESFSLGYSVFGTIMTNFIKKLSDETEKDKSLLFLAREGYILQELYEKYMELTGQEMNDHYYFKTSRRSVTVAAIKDDSDIIKIISQHYTGMLSNMFYSRLGLPMYDGIKDKQIQMEEDMVENQKEVMNLLQPHKEEIYKQFGEEKENYLAYVKSLVPQEKWKDIQVVDVGYSGTIQYFLSKLLNEKVAGYYLATFQTKPDKIGCEVKSVYNKDNPYISIIHKTQLFLESVLQAPYGQLIKFEKENGELVPKFKNDNQVPEEIVNLQAGMIAHCTRFAKLIKDIGPNVRVNDNMICDLYGELLHGDYMAEHVAKIFGVQDDYCSNKTLVFNSKTDTWE